MLVTNAIDVTERRHLHEMVAEKETRMRLAMDAANYGGWEWDRRSGAMIWTEKTRELLGVGADEPISFELFQRCIHPDDTASAASAPSPRRGSPACTAPSTASFAATKRCAGSPRAAE